MIQKKAERKRKKGIAVEGLSLERRKPNEERRSKKAAKGRNEEGKKVNKEQEEKEGRRQGEKIYDQERKTLTRQTGNMF